MLILAKYTTVFACLWCSSYPYVCTQCAFCVFVATAMYVPCCNL